MSRDRIGQVWGPKRRHQLGPTFRIVGWISTSEDGDGLWATLFRDLYERPHLCTVSETVLKRDSKRRKDLE